MNVQRISISSGSRRGLLVCKAGYRKIKLFSYAFQPLICSIFLQQLYFIHYAKLLNEVLIFLEWNVAEINILPSLTIFLTEQFPCFKRQLASFSEPSSFQKQVW